MTVTATAMTVYKKLKSAQVLEFSDHVSIGLVTQISPDA